MITCLCVVTLCIKSNMSFDITQNHYPNEKCEINGREKRERERENCVVQSAGHNCYLRDIVQSVI